MRVLAVANNSLMVIMVKRKRNWSS